VLELAKGRDAHRPRRAQPRPGGLQLGALVRGPLLARAAHRADVADGGGPAGLLDATAAAQVRGDRHPRRLRPRRGDGHQVLVVQAELGVPRRPEPEHGGGQPVRGVEVRAGGERAGERRDHASVLAMGVDPLTLATDLMTAVVVKVRRFDKLFSVLIASNAEG